MGATEIVVTTLTSECPTVETAIALLSETERHRARGFTNARDARRFILARARLRQLLGARLGVHPSAIKFVYGAYGKPSLAPPFAGRLQFNASRHGDVTAYVFSVGHAVGIDVEMVRELEDAGAIAARFFSGRENAAFRCLAPSDRAAGFFNCWTRKEAFVKALGDGLSHALDAFDVTLAPREPAKILRVANRRGDQCGWHLSSFSPAPGFVGAVVVGDGI